MTWPMTIFLFIAAAALRSKFKDFVAKSYSRSATKILLAGLLICLPFALAHRGLPPAPHDLWQAWSLQPAVLLGLALTTFLYGLGLCRLWRRAGTGKGVSRLQAGAFFGGLLALFIALVSPLDALSAALFSAHMVQHLLLIFVAAPLLVLGAPTFVLLWALPLKWRQTLAHGWQRAGGVRKLWHILSLPLLVWCLYTLIFWVWHLPILYGMALRMEFVHGLEHLSFLAAAGLFWWTLFQPLGRKRLSRGAAALYLFAASLQGSALGVLIVFSPQPWYTDYSASTAVWGLTPLQDQQLAGLIMWMPVGILYVILAAIFIALWLREADQDASQPASKVMSPYAQRSTQLLAQEKIAPKASFNINTVPNERYGG